MIERLASAWSVARAASSRQARIVVGFLLSVEGTLLQRLLVSRQYGISRGPLPEALRRRQERHLITRSANQGGEKLLFKADDFSKTNVRRAI